MDEPYADPSIIPSYIISNEISKHYKVAISGDGGDELLGGYEKQNYHLVNQVNLIIIYQNSINFILLILEQVQNSCLKVVNYK